MHYLQSFRLWIIVVTNTTCLLSHNEIAAIVKGVIGRSTQEKMLDAPAMKFFVDDKTSQAYQLNNTCMLAIKYVITTHYACPNSSVLHMQ